MNTNPEQDIAHIRNMMERSSRFISLSGLAGIFAGIYAFIAFAAALWVFSRNDIGLFTAGESTFPEKVLFPLALICVFTLIAAIGTAIFFTNRKTKRNHAKTWNNLTARLLINFAIPLIAGGIFCLAMLWQSHLDLVAPGMLIFYGLALINASKYTFTDVRYLGISELSIGLAALFLTEFALIFWVAGFGLLHIIYGIVMYRKYE